mmetsp:Transcript_28466/g.71514  ORF Transcript_28466/g.71514 Transcript_28466/m.71514 type:complete len:142 (-) Transcript_28466:606-1031(-)
MHHKHAQITENVRLVTAKPAQLHKITHAAVDNMGSPTTSSPSSGARGLLGGRGLGGSVGLLGNGGSLGGIGRRGVESWGVAGFGGGCQTGGCGSGKDDAMVRKLGSHGGGAFHCSASTGLARSSTRRWQSLHIRKLHLEQL